MIKAKKGKMMILGLSDENLKRLKRDQPIKFNMKDLGFDDVDVFIFNGKDEQVMQKMMSDAGLIDPIKTIIKDDNATNN
jgi:glutamine amidotransferase PdxT